MEKCRTRVAMKSFHHCVQVENANNLAAGWSTTETSEPKSYVFLNVSNNINNFDKPALNVCEARIVGSK